MFNKHFQLALWLLHTTVLLLAVIVVSLAYQLATNKKAIFGQEDVFYCGTTNEDYYESEYPTEVVSNEEGRAIFYNNCVQCHSLHSVIVGPPLANVLERHPKEWVYSFVLNSSKMVEEKDSAALAVFKEYGEMQMPAFAFSQSELDSLFDYINAQPNKIPVVATD